MTLDKKEVGLIVAALNTMKDQMLWTGKRQSAFEVDELIQKILKGAENDAT